MTNKAIFCFKYLYPADYERLSAEMDITEDKKIYCYE